MINPSTSIHVYRGYMNLVANDYAIIKRMNKAYVVILNNNNETSYVAVKK